MRRLTQVALEWAVLHLVPHAGPTLSDLPLPLDRTDDGQRDPIEFLERHVVGGLGDPQAVAANFVQPSSSGVEALVEALLAGPPRDRIDLSQRLARRLHQIVSGNRRISAGTLAVLVCTGSDDAGATQRFLALLKLDPSKGYRTEVAVGASGRLLKLVVNPDILPSTRERLQKAAFIRPRKHTDPYRLRVVDRQTADVARFFMTTFLEAEPTETPETRTKAFYTAVRNARNDVQGDLTGRQLAALDKMLDAAVVSAHVNVDEFVAALPIPDDVRDDIAARVAADVVDREFDPDPGVAEGFRRVTFEGDNGLRVSLPAAYVDSMLDYGGTEGTSETVRQIVIKTKKWTKR